MKSLVVYSSKTGNTQKVAQAIFEIMPQETTDLCPVEEQPSPDSYDFIILGFWADRENPDSRAQKYMKLLKNKKVALFATLGASPDSDHAKKTMQNARQLIEKDNTLIGDFICRGKIDPKITARFKNLPPDHPHALTPERLASHQEASKHPDARDLQKAQEVFRKIYAEVLLPLNPA